MVLLALLLLPLAGAGALLAFGGSLSARGASRLALVALVADLGLALAFWGRPLDLDVPWIPSLGASFHLAADGLTQILVLLALLLAAVAAGQAGREDHAQPARYQALLLLTTFTALGVFLAADLLVFLIFFEAMLLPSTLALIGWGRGTPQGDSALSAGLRFFLFTQAGGLAMMAAIGALYVTHGQATGVYTLDYATLLGNPATGRLADGILLGFLLAFGVKLPIWPLNAWQARAYAAAPASLGILLAGVLAKTGAYGFARYAIPLLPGAAQKAAPVLMVLGVVSMVLGAWTAYGQQRLRGLIAYSSLSHLGLLVAGLFAFRGVGYQGAVLQMFAHGLSVAGLFLLVHEAERRHGTDELAKLGGLWRQAPAWGGLAILMVMATVGLPGLANFVGELLVLVGLFGAWPGLTIVAVLAPVLGALYGLKLARSLVLGGGPGEESGETTVAEKAGADLIPVVVLAALLVLLGFFPNLLLRAAPAPAPWQGGPAAAAATATESAP